MSHAKIFTSYDFGPPSLLDETAVVTAWNIWEEEVRIEVRLSFALDEHDNKVVTEIVYVTSVLDAEYSDLRTDTRDSLIKQGYQISEEI